MAAPPPEEIDGGIVCLRRVRHDDAAALEEAIEASIDHLRPWMPWMSRQPLREQTRHWCHDCERRWDDGSDFAYLLHAPGDHNVFGSMALHDRVGPGGIEIGYWIHVAHLGRGYATTAAGVLTEAALALPGIKRVEIRCDVANQRSAAVPARLGYRLDRIVDTEAAAPGETGRNMIWIYDPETLSETSPMG